MKTLFLLALMSASAPALAGTYCRAVGMGAGHPGTAGVKIEWGKLSSVQEFPKGFSAQEAKVTLFTYGFELKNVPVVFYSHGHSTRCGPQRSSEAIIDGRFKVSIFDDGGACSSSTGPQYSFTTKLGQKDEFTYQLECSSSENL